MATMKVAPPITPPPVNDCEFALEDFGTAFQNVGMKLIAWEGYETTGRKHAPTVAWPRDLEGFRPLLIPLQEEATELGKASLSRVLMDEICRVLAALYRERPGHYPMYMMQDGSVAIDIRGPRPDGILVRIKPDMTVHCSGEHAGQRWRQPYPILADFPDPKFLHKLAELGVRGTP